MNGCKRIQESLTNCLYVCCFVVVVVVVVAVVLFFGGEGWSNTRWTVIPFSGGGVQQQNTHGRFMLLVLGLAVGIRISHMY